MRTHKGFTLIELVIAMLIAAILAAIAIPAYSNYVRKSHRTDAKSTLLDLASLEERFFSTNNTYTSTWSDLGYGTTTGSISSPAGYYTIAVPTINTAIPPTATTPGSPASYSFTATATGNQVNDTTCNTFTVTSGGARTAQNSSSVDTTSSCW